MHDFSLIDSMEFFNEFIRISKEEMTLLGAPILQGPALDKALKTKVDDLDRTVQSSKDPSRS